jgi:hypothetical protein
LAPIRLASVFREPSGAPPPVFHQSSCKVTAGAFGQRSLTLAPPSERVLWDARRKMGS